MRSDVVACRTIFPLGTMPPAIYDGCMSYNIQPSFSKQDTDHHVSNPPAPLVSEMLPAFLDYLRVEEHRTPTTLIRYESHIQKFIATVGDCPIIHISSETISIHKRRLLDESLAPATIAAMLSGLRSFLRYLKAVRGFQVYDQEKVRRPKIPKHEVEYFTKEEVARFLTAIPMHTQPGLRDRALGTLGN